MAPLLTRIEALIARGTKPTVPEVQPLVAAFYALPENGAGGSLHVVLDDGNVADGHVEGCIEYAEKRGDAIGAALGRLLMLCSKTQREKLNGYVDYNED
jgi:hypothetical protein